MTKVPETVLVEYFLATKTILALVVRQEFSAPEVMEIGANPDDLRRFVARFFAPARLAQLESEIWRDWDEVFSPLAEPILRWTKEGDTVWFVPHDVLHSMPLHALPIDGGYLIDRNPVCYTPSASVRTYSRARRTGRRKRALVLGDSLGDLGHAREEARTVADLFGTTAYVGEQASRDTVRRYLGGAETPPDIIHFACHVYFDAAQPLHSGIVLAPETGTREAVSVSLTAGEIMQLRLEADLVTLSGCVSGVNEREPGDELLGLTRALLYAGTPSVLVSLWPVNDLSTCLLMEQFYRELMQLPEQNEGCRSSKAEALQRAQRHLRSLTATQVTEYCAERLERPNSEVGAERSLYFRLDLAEASLRAGDLERASRALREAEVSLAARPELAAGELRIRIQRDIAMMQTTTAVELAAPGGPEERRLANPSFWAPFVLVGDDR
jgi:CHAT domain-containing protein